MTTTWQICMLRRVIMPNNTLLVDTSAFYALMDRSDNHHETAVPLWVSLLKENHSIMTTNYVVLETLALLQGRLGFDAAHVWYSDILGVVDVRWTDECKNKIDQDHPK